MKKNVDVRKAKKQLSFQLSALTDNVTCAAAICLFEESAFMREM